MFAGHVPESLRMGGVFGYSSLQQTSCRMTTRPVPENACCLAAGEYGSEWVPKDETDRAAVVFNRIASWM